MYGRYRLIKMDLFDIAKRIKEIDRDYFIIYNYKKKRFEVHNSAQKEGTLCLVIPFARLDARTITLILKTRRERSREIYEEMERDNLRLMKEEKDKAVRHAQLETENLLRRNEY